MGFIIYASTNLKWNIVNLYLYHLLSDSVSINHVKQSSLTIKRKGEIL